MPFKDLRDFIAKLEQEGEAQRIEEEVDWNLEAGAMVRRANEEGLPAPFFQKIKDYPAGYTLFGGPLAKISRVAIALDMAPDTPYKEVVEEYIRRTQKPIKPVLVSHGPCKENIHVGNEVDLLEFPAPMIHHGDGGRYFATMHLNITKDLDSDWINWGMHRGMLQNKNAIGILAGAGPATHFMMISRSWESRNKPMEIAIVIGTEPVSSICAASPIPYGVSEVDIAGGMRGEPVELVKCETIDLEVPATSEIVIEGEMRTDDTMEEGPFGEVTGYRTAGRVPKPVIRVKAITHRNNPIFTISCMGAPIDDAQTIGSVSFGADYLQALRERGFPVTGVYVSPEAATQVAVVAIKPPYANVAGEIAHVMWSRPQGRCLPYIIVVEDDVDPYNMNEVIHTLFSKCHPYRGIVRLEHSVGISLLPFLSSHERKFQISGRAYFDCTSPVEWAPEERPERVSFKQNYPAEVQRSALAKWAKYGY